MSLSKVTSYAPDVYRGLNGILLAYKPPLLTSKQLRVELRERISDALCSLEPRPLSKRLLVGEEAGVKYVTEVPNLADHPLVVGPRYLPWELSMSIVNPLSYRSSGISVILLGSANRLFFKSMKAANLVSVYHIRANFGYVMDNYFHDGLVHDKSTYKHIRPGRIDAVLSRIMSTQSQRLFDAAAVPLDSQEAYELAKAWPSRPPKMARWPVIYRLRCIHMNLPEFKLEVVIMNENELFLARLVHDIGLMLKSGAYTESIRRVKLGPFDVKDSLTDKDWDLQSIVNNLSIYNEKQEELVRSLREHRLAISIKSVHLPEFILDKQKSPSTEIGESSTRNSS